MEVLAHKCACSHENAHRSARRKRCRRCNASTWSGPRPNDGRGRARKCLRMPPSEIRYKNMGTDTRMRAAEMRTRVRRNGVQASGRASRRSGASWASSASKASYRILRARASMEAHALQACRVHVLAVRNAGLGLRCKHADSEIAHTCKHAQCVLTPRRCKCSHGKCERSHGICKRLHAVQALTPEAC